jgi:hypothetical protein
MALIMEAAKASETSVNFYQTAWSNISEDSRLQLKNKHVDILERFYVWVQK